VSLRQRAPDEDRRLLVGIERSGPRACWIIPKEFLEICPEKIPILKSKFSFLFPKNFGSLAQCRLREETPLSASFRPGATSGGLIRVRMR
jgi:hypothetical protein